MKTVVFEAEDKEKVMLSVLKKKFIGDRHFYKRVLLISVPMIVQNLITSFVSLLDNIMVGQIGTEQMSGVAIVNQLLFVFQLCIFGAVSGAGIFGTQFFGKGDYEGQKYTFRFKNYIIAAAVAVWLAVFLLGGTRLISLYLSDAGSVGDITLALEYGRQYLAVMLFSLLPFALCQSYVSTVRETGETFIPMLASTVSVFTNLILNYLLIFGHFGFPEMGVRGAALATVTARFVECGIVLIWTHMHREKNRFIVGAYRSFYIPGRICKDILIKGAPLMVNELLWAAGMATIVQCYAVRGLEVVAAQNISSTITNLFNTIYLQLGCAISVVVGQLLGAGKVEEAKDADNKMFFFCVGSCVVIAALMMCVGRYFPNIYNTEDSIRAMAADFITVAALVMPLCAISHCSYFTLRTGGKNIITFMFDSVYVWVLVTPLAYVLAHFTQLNIVTVFLLVQMTELVKAVIGICMVKSGVWAQNIVGKN